MSQRTAVSDDLLKAATRRLVEEFHPEKVFLFGSRAWGRPQADSDVDLMIVVHDHPDTVTKALRRAYRCLRGLRFSKDILLRTVEDFQRNAVVVTSLEAQIQEKGRLLYGSGQAQFD